MVQTIYLGYFGGTMSNGSEVAEAARKAIDSADFLNLINGIFLSLAIAGSALLAFRGIIAGPQDNGGYLIVLAVVALLCAIPFFALMRAVAMGTRLAGLSAQESYERQVDQAIMDSSVPAGRVRQAISDIGCATCGSRNLRETLCQRCGSEAVELTTGSGWYVTVDNSDLEQFFDGHTWTEEFRPSKRYTIDNWTRSEPGWLQDPSDPYLDRFWDGRAWTAKVRDAWGDNEGETPPS